MSKSENGGLDQGTGTCNQRQEEGHFKGAEPKATQAKGNRQEQMERQD